MIKIMFSLVLLVALSGCKQKNFTMEELEKAKWDSLSVGIDYISTSYEIKNDRSNDSIELKLKGISGNEADPMLEIVFKKIPTEVTELLLPLIRKNLSDSKAGFLRIDLYKMIRPSMLEGMIYLSGEYSAAHTFHSDSVLLKDIPGIRSANFISKEKAKKKYMADGNTDWDKVLDANPLPNSIEIQLQNTAWSEKSLTELKNTILDKLTMASDVALPASIFKKSEGYFFFEYKRR